MPFQAAFQLEGQQDLRHGGGGHLAPAYQFVNRSGYGTQRLQHCCSLCVARYLHWFLNDLGLGLRLPERAYNIVRITHQNSPIAYKVLDPP